MNEKFAPCMISWKHQKQQQGLLAHALLGRFHNMQSVWWVLNKLSKFINNSYWYLKIAMVAGDFLWGILGLATESWHYLCEFYSLIRTPLPPPPKEKEKKQTCCICFHSATTLQWDVVISFLLCGLTLLVTNVCILDFFNGKVVRYHNPDFSVSWNTDRNMLVFKQFQMCVLQIVGKIAEFSKDVNAPSFLLVQCWAQWEKTTYRLTPSVCKVWNTL